VALHVCDITKSLHADSASCADSRRFLLVAFGETMTCLMILEGLAIGEDFLATFADQVPVFPGKPSAGGESCNVLVNKHGVL